MKIGVDQDWRAACLMYPETLDYYFRLVNVVLPKDKDDVVVRPEIGRKKIRRDSGHSDKGKKERGR